LVLVSTQHGNDEETLIKNADTAMYQAKERGKNNYQFYSNNLDGISTLKMKFYHSNQGMMVKTIIDMGVNLKFTVIAEGIETEEQVKFLTRNACQIGQGYYYSKPLSAEKLEEFLSKGNILTQ
jgi:predicted signal transduction protein with EAL and GGDEF domain